MVKPFIFARLPLIYFGPGKRKLLPALVEKYGRNLLLVTDQKSFPGSKYADELTGSLKEKGINIYHITISGEPSPGLIDACVRKYSGTEINVIAGIGGGSVLDAGKALSSMMYREENVKVFLEGVGDRDHPGTKLSYIALPTTSGTGSEATKNAVLSEVGKNGFKKSLRHDNFVPDVAIVDPELTISCPPAITAASGMDCFTQLTESFLSDKSNEYTDALAWEGIKAVKSSLFRSYKDGRDIDARTGMSFAALTSGICLANAGLGAVHGFASSAGGMFIIPHGVLCGTLMAVCNKITVRALRSNDAGNQALMKYAMLGRLFSDIPGKTEEFYIDAFIEYLGQLTEDLKLPRLRELGIRKEDIPGICAATDVKNNPAKLNQQELMEILEERL